MKVLASPLGDAQVDVLTSSGGAVALTPVDVVPSSPAFPNRIDHSVNSSRVDSLYSATPILRCNSAGNVAGGFNGGGTGNKCIMGVNVGTVALSDIGSISYTYSDLNQGIEPSPLPPYLNLMLDVDGDGSAWKVISIDPSFGPPFLNVCQTVTNLDGSKTTTWSAEGNNFLIVLGLPFPPLPPGGPGFVPPTEAVNPVAPYGLPGAWQSVSYSIATILEFYPNARIAAGDTGDGGLPHSPNKTLALCVNGGDSTTQLELAWQLSDVTFNGTPV